MDEARPPSLRDWRVHLGRVLRRRCPCCGRGKLFRSTFRLAESCDRCGRVYRRESGAMTGQMYLSAAVTLPLTAALVVGVFFLTDWGPWVSFAVCAPLVVGLCYGTLPVFMALWVAVDLWTDLVNEEPWVSS